MPKPDCTLRNKGAEGQGSEGEGWEKWLNDAEVTKLLSECHGYLQPATQHCLVSWTHMTCSILCQEQIGYVRNTGPGFPQVYLFIPPIMSWFNHVSA